MISLPEWSQIRMNDSHEKPEHVKGLPWPVCNHTVIQGSASNPESFAAFGSSTRGVPKRAIQGQLPGWVASTPLPSKLATMFFRWHLGGSIVRLYQRCPGGRGEVEWLRAWFQMLNVWCAAMWQDVVKLEWHHWYWYSLISFFSCGSSQVVLLNWRQDRTM